jgi:hypothetical protein
MAFVGRLHGSGRRRDVDDRDRREERTNYTFPVTATNAIGSGPASIASNAG